MSEHPKQELAPAQRLARDFIAALVQLLSTSGPDPPPAA